MNIDLLLNNQAEVVSLSEQGMSITEYLYQLISGDDAPATMMVNAYNGDMLRQDIPKLSSDDLQKRVEDKQAAISKSDMRITINDMLTDDDVMLFRAKPATQGVGIGEALQKLMVDQMGVSAEFLGQDAEPSMQAEVSRAMERSEAFWAETSQRNNLMRKVSNPYRDGDWFESCKPDDHD